MKILVLKWSRMRGTWNISLGNISKASSQNTPRFHILPLLMDYWNKPCAPINEMFFQAIFICTSHTFCICPLRWRNWWSSFFPFIFPGYCSEINLYDAYHINRQDSAVVEVTGWTRNFQVPTHIICAPNHLKSSRKIDGLIEWIFSFWRQRNFPRGSSRGATSSTPPLYRISPTVLT